MSWDQWSSTSFPLCKTFAQLLHYEKHNRMMTDKIASDLVKISGKQVKLSFSGLISSYCDKYTFDTYFQAVPCLAVIKSLELLENQLKRRMVISLCSTSSWQALMCWRNTRSWSTPFCLLLQSLAVLWDYFWAFHSWLFLILLLVMSRKISKI